MNELNWTPQSQSNLQQIYDYIAESDIISAEKVLNGIFDKAQILLNFPEIGFTFNTPSEKQIRLLLYGHYRIVYIVKDSRIDILGVIHGSMDINRLFN